MGAHQFLKVPDPQLRVRATAANSPARSKALTLDNAWLPQQHPSLHLPTAWPEPEASLSHPRHRPTHLWLGRGGAQQLNLRWRAGTAQKNPGPESRRTFAKGTLKSPCSKTFCSRIPEVQPKPPLLLHLLEWGGFRDLRRHPCSWPCLQTHRAH